MKFNKNLMTGMGFYLGMTLMGSGCASIEKADLMSQSPGEAINEVASMESQLIKNQVDLQAPNLFFEGAEHLDEAQEDFKDGDEASEVLEEASYAKAYFLKARAKSQKLRPQNTLLKARMDAVSQQHSQNQMLTEKLYELDEEWREASDNFSKELTASEFSRLQKSYIDLEIAFVQHRELSSARIQLEKAENKDMDDEAPTTYNRLKREIMAAENMISANVKAPASYLISVRRAKSASKLMADVMAEFDKRGSDTSENVILALVAKNRKITTLNKSMDELELEMINAEVDAMAIGGELKHKNEKLNNYQAELDYQNAMNTVKNQFNDDQVSVFRQGDALVIRMKNIKFNVGSSEIPQSALSSLDQVKSIVERFAAPSVIVQGHTDATGPNKLNKKLSEKRAQSVAKYLSGDSLPDTNFKSVGYGETKPIVSNNTKDGRAKNRRVDIVIKTNG